MSVRSFYLPPQGNSLQLDLEYHHLVDAVKAGDGLLWVDFENPEEEHVVGILTQIFSFHPLMIDDALRESNLPKVDDWVNYLYLVLHLPPSDGIHAHLTMDELDVFLGKNYLVTYHQKPLPIVDKLWETVQRDNRYLQHGPIYLLYRLIDEVVASYLPLVDDLTRRVESMEEALFQKTSSQTLEQVFTLKRVLANILRTFGHLGEVIMEMTRDEHRLVDARSRYYFRNTYDHLRWIEDNLERTADQSSQILDTYLLLLNNKMSEAIKMLTVIATFFLPLSFLASFFGMNFFVPASPIRAWVAVPVFLLVLVIMVAFPYGLYRWFRRKGWV